MINCSRRYAPHKNIISIIQFDDVIGCYVNMISVITSVRFFPRIHVRKRERKISFQRIQNQF